MKLSFEKNLGYADRTLRVFIGMALLWTASLAAVSSAWSAIATIMGLFELVQESFAYSVLYDIMGWSTRESESIIEGDHHAGRRGEGQEGLNLR